MTDFTNSRLLYRGTRDGFSGEAYYSLVSVSNTVTVIKTQTNCVFGGYTSIGSNRSIGFYADPKAFIFSLRRNGTINNVKLRSGGTPNDPSGKYAVYIGPTLFAFGYDMYVTAPAFTRSGSSDLCYTYECPVGCSYGDSCSRTYLAGRFSTWYADEIEAYQLS
jgi:hypothetical protein